MKKNYIVLLLGFLILSNSCIEDDEFLNKEPTDILLQEQVFSSPVLITNVLADLYDRLPVYQNIVGNGAMDRFAEFNEAYISRNGTAGWFENNEYGYDSWAFWDYGYIRELNLFLERMREVEPSAAIDEETKARFIAEARFIRALVYFEMVKRMGGVPIITETLEYDFSGDPTYLQHPRAKEHEVYDFIINELEEITPALPASTEIKGRATQGATMAYISRAALYAGSIAKYGATTPSVSLPGGEVGIPASMANDYYTIALEAAQEVMEMGYELYLEKPEDLSENFADLFLDKTNSEVIFAEDFMLKHKFHNFTVENQPFSMTAESFGGRLNPSLNIVEEFELLDGTFAPLPNREGGELIKYEEADDIFEGRDARLHGTVITPGSTFRGVPVDIWGGYRLPDGTTITATDFVTLKTLPGKNAPQVVVGGDGPIPGREFTAQTGFYIRKYQDPTGGAGELGTQSAAWWIRMRYAEVLLNAAEAAFELGQTDLATQYINQVRARAGFGESSLTPADITFDRIVHERKVEFAFENHILWDMKRWRLAHEVWNGNTMTIEDLESNLGEADKPMTQIFGLIPYKYYDPAAQVEGQPEVVQWVFEIVKPHNVTGADRFRLGNYYSDISDGIIANNPKIVRNPNQ